MAKLAFLGLGVMGFPMAGHLAKAGHDVTVYNRTPAKNAAWAAQHGGSSAATPAAACHGADIALLCVGADKDVEAVVAETLAGLTPGSLIVDHTTIGADTTRKLYGLCKTAGVGFVDAPVSGGQAGAENGQLTIMAGGDADDFARAEPVMAAYAKRIGHMGPSGAGQLTKMVNQICIAGVLQGLSEALAFARKAGLDANAVLDVISKGAAQSWQMDNRGKTMVAGQFDFGFAVDWMRKDLGLVLNEAKALGLDLPVAHMVNGFYAEVQAMGGNRQDTSSLIRRYMV
jgi:3-hydroxyisobutyrate dehydrogenase